MILNLFRGECGEDIFIMQIGKGCKILISLIISSTLFLAGCAKEEAPGGVTDVPGALFLSENEGGTDAETETADPQEHTEGGTLAAEPGISEISAAAGEEEREPAARKLTDSECAQMQEFINQTGTYGFLRSVYDSPRDLDAEQVFFAGAGLETAALDDEEREAYLARTGEEEAVNVFRIGAQQVSDYLQYRAGVSLEELTEKPDWVYLEEYDAYYISHGEEETNLCTFEVTDGAVQGDYFRVHYRAKRDAQDLDGWHIPVYEAILKKNGDSFRFCANRLWTEKGLLLLSYRSIVSEDGKPAGLCAYKPDDSAGETADVTFAIVKDKDVETFLPGMNGQNLRDGMIFEEVRALDQGDYDGDGRQEIAAICKYKYTDGQTGREDHLEARIYRFGEDGKPELDLKLSGEINRRVTNLTLSGIAHYIAAGSDRGSFRDWKEAFTAEVSEADPEAYDRFALIYISDDRTPELLEMGKTPEKGAKIVFFRDGILEETQISSDFSYLRKGNSLYSKNGTGLLFTEAVYVYAGNGFGVYQSGTYGTMDAAVTAYTKEKKPEYSFIWEGSSVTEAGYRDALSFVYDFQRALGPSQITMASAQEFLKQMKGQ